MASTTKRWGRPGAPRRGAVTASVIAFALVLAACGGGDDPDPDPAGTGDDPSSSETEASTDGGSGEPVIITIAQGVDTESGDAANLNATPSINIGYAIYDRLLARDPDGVLGPSLATDWFQVDDSTWEFQLRDDVLFHDGTPLTADDVVFTFERLLTGEYGATNNITPINGAEKVDDYTVRLTTDGPYAPTPARTMFASIVPKHYVEEVGDEQFNLSPMGSGPFKFVEWERDSRFVVERFDDYWDGPAAADQIVYRPISETSSRIAALRTGEVDIIVNVPPDLVQTIEDDPCCVMKPVPSIRTMFVGMNTNVAPLDDARVRQALNYAIDKDLLIETIMGGLAYKHDGKSLLFGPQVYGFDAGEPIEDYPYDPDRARELLAEAGYADGLTVEFEAPRGRYLNDAELAEAIAGMLSEVGVQTELTISEWGTFWPKTVEGNQQGLWFLGLGNTLNDAEYYYTLYLSSDGRGYYATDEMDERIRAQYAILDEAEREATLHEIHKTFVEEEAPWIFLWDQADLYATGADIVGWEPRADERIDIMTVTRSNG